MIRSIEYDFILSGFNRKGRGKMFIGHGDITRPVLYPCIEEKCAAYKDGYCMKYQKNVKEG